MNISIIIQRYGLTINGGAELHARYLAEKLAKNHEITVLTTQSTSYDEWANDIDETKEIINGVQVLRFSSQKKNHKAFRKYRRRLSKASKLQKLYKTLGIFNVLDKKGIFEPTPEDFNRWLVHQGPYCKGLVKHLSEQKTKQDVFIFFSYLFYPTNLGLPQVAAKSLLIPTAHDELPFYFKGYKNLFEKSQFIMYNSLSEKLLVERTYPIAKSVANDMAGVGVESIKTPLNKALIHSKYLIYIGRVDGAKNVDELISWFTKYNKALDEKMKLVLVGKNVSNLKGDKHVIFTGFVSEEEKYQWLENAKALVIPSLYESLSMVTLEAMAQGIPVIANAKCEVLENHIKQSETGYSYTDYHSFKKVIHKAVSLTKKERVQMGEKSKKYVTQNYSWSAILNKFEKAFDKISNK